MRARAWAWLWLHQEQSFCRRAHALVALAAREVCFERHLAGWL